MAQEREILGAHWWTTSDGCVGIVAVAGGNDDWAAYIGIGYGANIEGDEQHVAATGAKLAPDYATMFFSWLDVKKYRE